MKNIVLIGMPGAGKSTIGVILAKALGMRFIDTDIIIQERENKLLQDIIDSISSRGFLSIEEKHILELDCCNTVIATGGSVIYSKKSIEHLKKNGLIVYLEISIEEIITRVNNIKTRGIVLLENQSMQSIYEERTPLYEKAADVSIHCSNKTIESIVDEIMQELI